MQPLEYYRENQVSWRRSRLSLQQQLEEAEKEEIISLLSEAIQNKRLQRWTISQQCFMRVCEALKIPLQYLLELPIGANAKGVK